MTRTPRFLLPFLAGALWIGCTSAPRSNGPIDLDASVEDGGDDSAAPDAPTGDAPAGDAASQDAVPPDAPPADTSPADVPAPDADPVDAPADVTAPDAAPDAAPDVAAPDAAPDVAAPDAPADAAVDVTTDRADAAPADVLDAAADRPDAAADAAPDVAPMDAAVDVPADRPDAAADAAADAADVAVCTPATESCNGRDDDCDGLVDENGCSPHLLLSEVAVGPTEAEFIEVHNPTAVAVDLSNYYLSDFHDYACLLGRTCTIAGRTAPTSVATSDFVARFPAGVTVPPNGYVVVTTAAPERFAAIHGGRCPDFYLPASGLAPDGGTVPLGSCTSARAMRSASATASTVGAGAGLTNGGELAVLFRWDGASNLVEDVDYVFWGATSSSNLQVDKSGTSAMGTMYRADTPAAMQQRVAQPEDGASAVRCNFGETGERTTGGNGLSGHDETSEPLMVTWRTTAAPARNDAGMISTANATPGAVNNCR